MPGQAEPQPWSPWYGVVPQAHLAQPPYSQGPHYASVPPIPYPHAAEPNFTVRLRKHTGLGVVWFSQSYSVTGTYRQCEAAITDAQRHNLAAGWWSIASIVLWNWIALGSNANSRKELRRIASQYGYAPPPK
jgi:hypothetical protein